MACTGPSAPQKLGSIACAKPADAARIVTPASTTTRTARFMPSASCEPPGAARCTMERTPDRTRESKRIGTAGETERRTRTQTRQGSEMRRTAPRGMVEVVDLGGFVNLTRIARFTPSLAVAAAIAGCGKQGLTTPTPTPTPVHGWEDLSLTSSFAEASALA